MCKHFPNTPAQFRRLDYHSGVTASRETKNLLEAGVYYPLDI